MFNLNSPRSARSIFATAALALLSVTLFGQNGPRTGNTALAGVPEDWSSHHVVFADPGTEEAAIQAGRHDVWLRTVNDPRYIMQQIRRKDIVRGPAATDPVQFLQTQFARSQPPATLALHKLPKPKNTIKNDWSVNLTTSSVMPNTYPAKYSFSPISAPNCTTDFVAYPTGATGSATQATIVAFNELYPGATPGCGTSGVPQFYWAYNTTISGTAPGGVTTSPVLSLDGTMVAFVQSDGSSANLIVLKTAPAAGESVTAPVSIAAASANMSCTAPCMSVTPLGGSDTFSSPYYDYANDILYVGDDSTTLYKVTHVFSTTASPVATTLALDSGALKYTHTIASPVYDSVSGCVFAGDSGGFFYSVNSGIPGTVCTSSTFSVRATSPELSARFDGGTHDAVLLDSQAGEVYAFLTEGGNVTQCGSGVNCLVQFPTNFSDGAGPGNAEPIGGGGFQQYIFAGTFDNVYFSSADPAHPSGNLWVVGNVNDFQAANLYQIPIAASVMGTPVATQVGFAAQVNGNAPYTPGFATPITEFCNNGGSACGTSGGQTTSGTDTIYFGINQGSASACHSSTAGAGCVVAYNISNPASPALTGYIAYSFPGEDTGTGVIGCWGTSSIVIDNASTSTGASEVYYMYLGGNSPPAGTSGCAAASGNTVRAIQAAQGTL
ncbi:MAG TPA: hypothetical protein VKT75_03305 [Acidobacteriaceae bacterium]|nr:hypothetical protein [Acidobacteriaceae bacterium]